MANNILDISMITNEALMVLENELNFAANVDRTYDDRFAIEGAKIGNTVNVRRPARFKGTVGPALNVEDFNEGSIPLTLTTQFHVDTQFNTQELALGIDEFSDRVIKPGVQAVANRVDADGLQMAQINTANVVGTPGTPPTGVITYMTAGAYLDSEGFPRVEGQRRVVYEPFASATIVDGLKGLLAPTDRLGKQYDSGLMTRAMGMDWAIDQNVVSKTYGSFATTAGALTMNGASQGLAAGWAQFSTLSIATTQTVTLQPGDTFTIAGVYGVNPQNRLPYGSNRLRSFVVTSAVTSAAGNFSVTVAPALIYGGQFQNVSVTNAAGAAVTPLSIASTTAGAVVSPQNIVYDKKAFALVMADLEVPKNVDFAGKASDKKVGMSIRIVRDYTIQNDAIPTRIDVLYGWGPLYQEGACKVAG